MDRSFSLKRRWLSTLLMNNNNNNNNNNSNKKGVPFENETLETLKRYRFCLKRCGGPNDGGIDLEGTWDLFGSIKPSVVVQCKGGDSPTPINILREFEGSLLRRKGSIGLISSRVGFTSASQHHLLSCSQPIILIQVVDGELRKFRANNRVLQMCPSLSVALTNQSKIVLMEDDKILIA